MRRLDALASRQLIVVTGKGGVGKTTIAAALARLLAAGGKKTLLLEIDPRESLHQLLGTEPSGGHLLKVGARLTAQNLQPGSVVDGLVREKIPVGALARRIVASPVYRHFADGAPGLREVAVLGYALRAVQGRHRPRADCVVLDAPATGHGASMLAAPLLLADAVGGGQLGDMARELAEFVADADRCGVVLAALAEEMPVQEAVELIALLRERMGRPPELVVVNSLYPAFPAGSVPQRPGDFQAAIQLWRERRQVNERELARLRSAWRGALAELPLVPLPRGPELLAAIERELGGQLG